MNKLNISKIQKQILIDYKFAYDQILQYLKTNKQDHSINNLNQYATSFKKLSSILIQNFQHTKIHSFKFYLI